MTLSAVPRGVRNLLSAALAALALLMVATAQAAALTPQQQAPANFRADGLTLRWSPVSGVSGYKLSIKVESDAPTYKVLTGTSYTPPSVPGKSVVYYLRTNVDGSVWGAKVTIRYAASTPAPAPPYPASNPSPTPAPTPAATPAQAPANGKIRIGVVSNSDYGTTEMMNRHQAMGSPSVRWEVGRSADFSTGSHDGLMDDFARRGIQPLVLFGWGNSYPSSAEVERFCRTYSARFARGGTFWNGKSYSDAVKPAYIEFGNETSYSYHSAVHRQPETYARLFKTCAEAARKANPNMKVLAQAEDPANVGWLNKLYATVPDLNNWVGGWTSHPYGPESRSDNWLFDQVYNGTAAKGSNAPILVTEWGLSTDNGRCLNDNYQWGTCMTYGQARDAFVSTVNRWKSKYGSRLTHVYYFQTKDRIASGDTNERENFFGLTQIGGAPKQPFYDTFVNMVRNGV